jgi:hypothetical protein
MNIQAHRTECRNVEGLRGLYHQECEASASRIPLANSVPTACPSEMLSANRTEAGVAPHNCQALGVYFSIFIDSKSTSRSASCCN